MAGGLLPQPKQVAFDSAMNPGIAYQFYTYAAGSLTPKDTFQDAALTIPNTNPAVANARGEVVMYGSGSYRIIQKDALGNLIWDRDNIEAASSSSSISAALAASSGSSLLGFKVADAAGIARTAQDKLREVVSPMDFGAVGDGVADDGLALNQTMAYVRARIDAAPNQIAVVRVDGAGKTYATTQSVNATKLREGWELANMTILGKCTGKAVVDIIGSRSGRLTNFTVRGDKTSRPSVGIQAARAANSLYAFCDGMLFDKVFTNGYFSTAAIHMYGQEGTNYHRCKFWNSDKDAYVAIHTGYNSVPMLSDYEAPMTGSCSYINNKYVGVDYLFLPEAASATITGISKANPAVITAPGHPFVNGQVVVIGYVNGMAEINNLSATVNNATANTFQLAGVDSSAFGTYTSGGSAIIAQTKPTVLFARGEQHHFDTCYVVNYGTDSVLVDFPDGATLKSVWFDMLFEGAGSRSHVRFNTAGTIYGYKLLTYNTHCRDSVMTVNSGSSGTVALYNAEVTVANFAYGAPTLVDTPARYALYGADVAVPTGTTFNTITLGDRFTGTLSDLSGKSTAVNQKNAHYLDGPYTPTAIATSGALGSVTATGVVQRVGDMGFVEILVTIASNGTGTGSVNVTLPFNAAGRSMLVGREYGLSGHAVSGLTLPGTNTLTISKYDGTYPGGTGAVIAISGWVRL